MSEIYGQSEAQTVRRRSQEPNLLDYSHRESATQGVGGRGEIDITQSVTRENCSRRDRVEAFIGGIIDQLIDSAQNRLVKTRECIVWYQSEQKEIEAQIQNLQQLKKMGVLEDDDLV